MNQISRICLCRSLFRRNPFTRRSFKSISSSLISNNPNSSNLVKLISKFHHTFNYPTHIFSIPGNSFQKFSGKAAAEKCNFDDDYLENEIFEIHNAVMDARENIETGTLPPLDAVKIPAEKFNALIEKLGLDNEKDGDFPHHLQRFREKIYDLEEAVDENVAFGKFVGAGKDGGVPNWDVFKDWYNSGGKFVVESSESENESDTLPTMRVDADADNTNQGIDEEFCASSMERQIKSELRQMRIWSSKYRMGKIKSQSPFKRRLSSYSQLRQNSSGDWELLNGQ